MKLYRIRDWNRLFENNRSRTVENLSWVPIPNRHDGENYSAMIMSKHGSEVFSAFILMLEVASRCSPRGTLIRSNGVPHDENSLSQKTRAPKTWFERAFEYLESNTDWLEVSDVSNVAVGCQATDTQVTADCHPPDTQPSVACHPTDEEGRKERTEQNGKKGTPQAADVFENLQSEKFKAVWATWIEHLRQKRRRLTEHAVYLQLKKCSEWGETRSVAAIEHSIEHNWQSIFESHEQSQKSNRGRQRGNPRLDGVSQNNAVNDYERVARERRAKADADLAGKMATNPNGPPP